MFNKILIANRGEIAVRVIRACREMGVRTVAVFSDADRMALHVRLADEAYRLGPALARESYLHVERILDVARRSRAQAIHPGYGFLAENADFADACEAAGFVFIGPPGKVHRAVGEKTSARRTLSQFGVPIVPGTLDAIGEDGEAEQVAAQIGYPVFLKAAAGGGGKGMRLVRSPAELAGALRGARSEARSAFADSSVYLEKAVDPARHVEIQFVADRYGHAIHLGERECTIQRRHQKVLEESPSTALDEDLRQRMGEVAVRVARAVGYVNAGTAEFLLDAEKNFYFMEINSRLQVEHPVTELVTGIDLVKVQLRIAAGEPLDIRQEDVRFSGSAIQCRIYAEDPFNRFLPSTGRILALREPSGPGVRVDSAVYPGAEVTIDYDPMIAKLLVHAPTRDEAIVQMARALREYVILGPSTTIPFHQFVMENRAFREGRLDTHFVEQEWHAEGPDGAAPARAAALIAALAAARGPRAAPAGAARQPVAAAREDRSRWRQAARLGGLRPA